MSKKTVSSTSVRFALYSFKGVPTAYYVIDEITPPVPTLTKEVKHHIYIVDASGSMYGVIRDTATMVEKVMTVEEFSDENQLISLISYSSQGDVILHFARVPVTEVLKPGSPHVEQIRALRAKSMTCASQALALAHTLIKDETTGISLHTDGFFNDPSPTAEQRAFDLLVEKFRPMKNVFVNTIAYGYADYVAMSRISNALSGKCIQATTVKDVYTAFHDTQALLSGRLSPAIVVAKGNADYQVSLNVTQKKINGTTADLLVRGARPEDDMKIYRYRKVTEAAYNEVTTDATALQIYAFARAKLAEGKINDSRFALCATMNQTLLEKHYKSLTNAQLTAMGLDLEIAMFSNPASTYAYSSKPGLANADKVTLPEIFDLLNAHTKAFTVDLDVLRRGYIRKGVKKVSGIWSHEQIGEVDEQKQQEALATSTFLPCPFRAYPTDDATMVSVSSSGFSINNTEATVNLLLERPAKIEKSMAGKKEEVRNVAGIKLDGKIYMYNNYTVVSGGDVSIEALPLRIEQKALHTALVDKGVLAKETFDAKKLYLLPLDEFPVVAFDQKFGDLPADLVLRMARRRGLIALCEAILKVRPGGGGSGDGSDEVVGTSWTVEQENELKAHCLTPKLYFSPPTRNPYKDKKQAIANGLVDTRPRYTIDIGDKDLLSLRDLPSANAFFGRRFLVGGKDKKKIADLFDGSPKVEVKPIGKMKIGPTDEILFPLYESFLGFGNVDFVSKVLFGYGVSEATARKFKLVGSAGPELQAVALEVKNTLVKGQEKDYALFVRPLAFYIGSSGLVPDGWDVQVLDATALAQKFPKVGKGDPDATYLVSGEIIITFAIESVDVLTDAGLLMVKELMNKGAEMEA